MKFSKFTRPRRIIEIRVYHDNHQNYDFNFQNLTSPSLVSLGHTDIDRLAKAGDVVHYQSSCQNPKKI